MNANHDAMLRQHLLSNFEGNAHMTFDDAVKNFPLDQINAECPNSSYTPYGLLVHIVSAQVDILNFIVNPHYKEQQWPEDYWPHKAGTAADWEATIDRFHENETALRDLVSDASTDLFATIPHGTGQTVLREILLVADHNAYHVGEFGLLREVMQTWRSDT
jgi:uncharacterized damage-inducible protein DinB